MPTQDNPQPPTTELSRRVVLRGAAFGGLAAPLLAACGGSGGDGGNGSGTATVAVADVPVGGGTILEDELVVVTQPTEGEFKAFSAVCTHQGCPVQQIADGRITCNCHGSQFSVVDGTVLAGPADQPLETKSVTLDGDSVTVS